jgi:hypothetical protein
MTKMLRHKTGGETWTDAPARATQASGISVNLGAAEAGDGASQRVEQKKARLYRDVVMLGWALLCQPVDDGRELCRVSCQNSAL